MIALFIFLSALRNIFAREQVEMLNIFGHADGNLLDAGHWRHTGLGIWSLAMDTADMYLFFTSFYCSCVILRPN